MKKSHFITIFVLFVIASVLICIGCFVDPMKDKTEASPSPTDSLLNPSIRPIETEDNVTATPDVPDVTPTENPEVTPTEAPTETPEPTATPLPYLPFANVSNADYDKYENRFEFFSTRWETVDGQNKATIQDFVKSAIPSDLDYVFYTINSDTDWDNYMTFSMHYEDGYTDKVLDLLKQYDVKAVFFITYEYITENPELVKRMVAEGHLIGNRGMIDEEKISHATAEEYAAAMLKVEREYQKLFGASERMYLFRTDFFSQRTLEIAKAMGYTVVFRTYSYFSDGTEYAGQPAAALAERFNERAAYNGSVPEFVCQKQVYDALKIFLPTCIDEHVQFKLIQRRY